MKLTRSRDAHNHTARPSNQASTGTLERDRPQVMQVLALYGGAVITHHQRSRSNPGAFTVGFGVDADCVIAAGSLPTEDAYPLAEVTVSGDLHVHVPEGMGGEVLLDQRLYQISALRDARRLRAHPTLGCDTLRLPPRARCRLSIGEITFVISSLPDPGSLPRRALLDQIGQATLRSLGGVIAVLTTLWVIFSLTPQAPDDLYLSQINAIERYVSVELDSPEVIVTPKLDDHDEGVDSIDLAAADPSTPPRATNKETIAERVARPMTTAQRRAAAQEAVGQLLGGVSSLTRVDAVSQEALSHFTGVGELGASDRGPLSLGGIVSTSRHSGDGVNLTHSVKVTTQAKRPMSMSSCLSSVTKCSRKGAKRPKVKPLSPRIERGSLPRSVVRRVILSRVGAYQNCYERELQRTRSLKGGLELSIKISPQGRVSLARVSKTGLKNPLVERCVLTHVRALIFPRSPRFTIVRYPLRFESR